MISALLISCAGGSRDDTSAPSGTTPSAAQNENTGKEQITENKGNTDPSHTHKYGEWKDAGEGSCTTGAARERVCSECAAKETVYAEPAGHKMKDNVCAVCGAKASEGLEMEPWGDEYHVKGVGECRDRDIIIPDKHDGKPVTAIDEKAFYNNTDITSVTLPEGITEIGGYAFSGCKSLRRISFPDSLTDIDGNAFYMCLNLYTVTLPKNLQRISQKAFLACYKLVEVKNLSSLTLKYGSSDNGHVAYYAENIITEGDLHVYGTSGGYYYYDNGEKTLLLSYTGTDTELVLPADFNGHKYDLASASFSENRTIKSVEIREGTADIRPQSFYNCTSLATIKLPSTLKHVDNDAFRGCTAISSVIYNGAKDAWEKVDIDSGNDPMWDREITYNG